MPVNIGAWLRGLELEQYAQAFHDNAIDDDILSKLTADDLKDLGVSLVGHRRKLLEAIAALQQSPLLSGAPGEAPGVVPGVVPGAPSAPGAGTGGAEPSAGGDGIDAGSPEPRGVPAGRAPALFAQERRSAPAHRTQRTQPAQATRRRSDERRRRFTR